VISSVISNTVEKVEQLLRSGGMSKCRIRVFQVD
jgi:hypothetical protein